MKIAHIITRMIIGGAQENTLHNCHDLVTEFGDEVLLMTGPSDGPEGELLEQGRASGVQTQLIPSLTRNIHPWHDWRAYRQIKAALKAFNPDVVHTHSAKAGLLGRRAAHKLAVPTIVHTVHGAPFHKYQSNLARMLFRSCEKYAARRCHGLICVADAMTEQLVDANVAPPSKFRTIYSGMDTEHFLNASTFRESMRNSLGFSNEHVVIGKIARLFHLKGHDSLINAAADVIATNSNVRFLLIGDGILREQLESQIEQGGLSKYFRFTGLISPSEIPKHLGAMDALVHTSLREGLARALPQALLAGIPIVSFDVDGAREACISNETGLLVPPLDHERLVAALVQIAACKETRERLGQNGQQLCRERFCHFEMTRQIRDYYLELAGN